MQWLEVSVSVDPEVAEAVAEVLSRYAPQGVAIDLEVNSSQLADHVVVKAYLVADEDIEARRRKVEESLWHLSCIWPGIPEPTFTSIQDQDWTTGWKESIPILHLTKTVVVRPSWREYRQHKEEIVLEMDPGMAFGTGLHPTTQLCAEALEALMAPNMRVLDLGTGTGILSLIAAKMGAEEVIAVDTDMNAVAVTRRNARANDVAHLVRPVHGSLADVSGTYDLILANILAHVIIDMANAGLAARVRSGGTLVVSGILLEQLVEVRAALDRVGLRVVDQRENGDWVALVAKKAAGMPPNLNQMRSV